MAPAVGRDKVLPHAHHKRTTLRGKRTSPARFSLSAIIIISLSLRVRLVPLSCARSATNSIRIRNNDCRPGGRGRASRARTRGFDYRPDTLGPGCMLEMVRPCGTDHMGKQSTRRADCVTCSRRSRRPAPPEVFSQGSHQ